MTNFFMQLLVTPSVNLKLTCKLCFYRHFLVARVTALYFEKENAIMFKCCNYVIYLYLLNPC